MKTGNDTWVYDTLQHQIGGFSQQQGSNDGIAFSSQFGTINLSSLPVVLRNGVPVQQTANPPTAAQPDAPVSNSSLQHDVSPIPSQSTEPTNVANPTGPVSVTSAQVNRQEILDTLDQLGGLLKKGYLTEAEFASKKADLLSRL